MLDMEYINTKSINRCAVEVVPGRTPRSTPAIVRTVMIFNEIHYPIGVASRDGLKYNLPPSTNLVRNAIIIQIRYTLSRKSKESLETLLCTNAVENSPELRLVKQQLLDNPNRILMHEGKFDIEYVITEKELKEHGGLVYIRDLDLVFSTRGYEAIKYHPYSSEAGLHAFGKECTEETGFNSGNKFTYSLKIIDNFGSIGKRWLRIGEDVVLIKPTRDKTQSDGIYVNTRKPSTNSLGETGEFVERYDPDKPPPYLKLFTNFHDAKNTLEDEMQMRMVEFEHKRLKLETEATVSKNALQRATQENENLRRTHEFAREKHANDMHTLRMQLEREIQERRTLYEKDKYDAISTDRKNRTETLKNFHLVVSGLISVGTVLQKLLK